MKRMNNPKSASLWMLLLGLAAAAARGLLYLLAVEGEGLIRRGHPCTLVLAVLCAAAVLLSLIPLFGKKASGRWEDHFLPGRGSALGCAVMAACIAETVASGNDLARGNLVLLWEISGLLAAAGLLWAAFAQKKGKKPFLLVYTLVCLFLALHMVSRYQVWSGDPQVMDWAFSLLGAVGMTLCAYQMAAFCIDGGHCRTFLLEGGLSVFFCCAALPQADYFWLYLGGAVWVFTALWGMAPGKEEG